MATSTTTIAGASAGALGAVILAGAALTQAPTITSALSAMSAPSTAILTAPDAVRLAKQATFGPNQALVGHMTTESASAWLDEQFGLTGSTYADLAQRVVPTTFCNSDAGMATPNCGRDYRTALPVQMRFYADAVNNPDQLRQRVAFALSQLTVASATLVHTTAGTAALNQIFLDNAFGNYRDILKAVTLNPFMGSYLNMADSQAAAPNENYAREMMQLFSIGVSVLNPDGTLKLDAGGAPIPTYTSDDVHSVARALSGWTYARIAGAKAASPYQLDYSQPMVPNTAVYDATAKSFLGRTVPAGATPQASVDTVIDAAFNHANTAPFVSKFLIQQLVISNPSPAYVQRVAQVFADNGSGVRGDMKAVIRAILLDGEARGDAKSGDADGKVKEPVLMAIALGRLIGEATDGYVYTVRDAVLGQEPFAAPSVFNFYPPNFPLSGSATLVSPPSKLMTTATAIARHNLAFDWTVNGDPTRTEYAPKASIAGAIGTTPDWSGWDALAADPDALIAQLNLLVFNNTLTSAQSAAIRNAVVAVTNKTPSVQAHKRAQTALYLAASSPFFQIDR